MKLSPNLRQKTKEEETALGNDEGPVEMRKIQVDKLNKILAQVVQLEGEESPADSEY